MYARDTGMSTLHSLSTVVAGLGIQLSPLPILNGGLMPVLTNHADSQVFARGLGGSTLVFRRWFDDEQGKSNSEEPLTSP